MAVPTYQDLMLPLLRVAAPGEELRLRDAVDRVAADLGLTEDDRKELTPGRGNLLLNNRLGWASTYLKQAGLLVQTRRGHFRITERGTEALAAAPKQIDNHYLKQFAEFRDFLVRHRSKSKDSGEEEAKDSGETAAEQDTPDEALARAHARLRASLQGELLTQVKSCSAAFFERLVVALLVKMGYGGSLEDAGRSIGRSGDGGIDGIIKEDRLGLDAIYIQAKRWENSVPRPEVQKFAGALQGHRAKKGVMLTTSTFTRGAQDYASSIDSRIVLIDGERLAQFMFDFGVGVSTVDTYEVKENDSDFFEE